MKEFFEMIVKDYRQEGITVENWIVGGAFAFFIVIISMIAESL